MTDEEKAESYTYKHLPKGLFDFELFKKMKEVIIKAYLDGLAEGRKESIKWHDINTTLPGEDGEYLIKCYQPYNSNFDGPYTFTTAADFDSYDNTFDIDFFVDTEILKWAEMPE